MCNKKENETGAVKGRSEYRHVGQMSTTVEDVLKEQVMPEDFGSESTEELLQTLLFCMESKKMLILRGKQVAFKITSIYD